MDGESVRSAAAASSEGGSREARLKSSYKTQVRSWAGLRRPWLTGGPAAASGGAAAAWAPAALSAGPGSIGLHSPRCALTPPPPAG